MALLNVRESAFHWTSWSAVPLALICMTVFILLAQLALDQHLYLRSVIPLNLKEQINVFISLESTSDVELKCLCKDLHILCESSVFNVSQVTSQVTSLLYFESLNS